MRKNTTNRKIGIAFFNSFLGLFLFSIIFIGNTNAQNGTTPVGLAPGSPAGSYSLSGFETINPYSGNLNFNLPLLGVSGRGGAGTSVQLTINQKWTVKEGQDFGDPYQYAEDVWWNEIYTRDKSYNNPIKLVGRRGGDYLSQYCGLGAGWTIYYKTLTRLTFTSPDGTEYEMRDQATGGAPYTVPNCSLNNNHSRGTVFVSSDGSFATFISDAPIYDDIWGTVGWGNETYGQTFTPSGYLYTRDGTVYRFDGSLSWMRDRNGNKMTFTYGSGGLTKITDSLNREITFEYDVNDTTTSSDGTPYGLCDKITYKGFGGATRVIRITYKNMEYLLRSGYSIQTHRQLFPNIYPPSYPSGHPAEYYASQQFNPQKAAAVWLPDGRRYKFQYNSHGELARVELLTGGAIEYDWADSSTTGSGVLMSSPRIYRRVTERRVYSDGSALQNKLTLGSTEWISSNQGYVIESRLNASNQLLTKTKHYYYGICENTTSPYPCTAVGVFDFYAGWKDGKEYQTDVFDTDGSTLLRRSTQTWQQTSPSWYAGSADVAPVNNSYLSETTFTLSDTNQVSKQTFTYDQFNNRTDTYEYDYGTGSAGALLRRTHTDFVTDTDYTSYTGSHLRSLPSQTWVSSDANGSNKASLTQYEYDNYTTDTLHAALVNRSNISGLDSSFTTSYTKRGNVTKVTSYADAQNQTGAVSAATQYDIAGNVVKVIDSRGNASTIDYTDRFGSPDGEARNNSAPSLLNGQSCYAAATSTTNALGYTSYLQVDYSTGKPVDAEDINGTVSTAFYNDALDRQTQIIVANNVSALKNQTTISYDDTNRIVTTTSDLRSYNDNLLKSQTLYDGLGRTTESRKYEIGSNYIATKQTYDALGRVYQSSNPFRPYLSETPIWTTTAYDALSRIVSVTTPDGLSLTKSYSGSQTTVTDQAGKKRRGIADALGRTTKVIEDPTGSLNYETTYTFDAVNNLRMTTQGDQKRYFIYDSLGRLLRSKNPEQDANTNLSSLTDPLTNNGQWAEEFTYDANDNVLTKKNARNITATMTYDELNRPLTRTYSDGTPTITLTYDSSSIANSKGKLTSVSSSVSTSNITGYDALGRASGSSQITSGQTYTMGYTYDIAGNLISQTYPSGRIVTNTVDDAGRLSSVTSQETNQPVKNYLSNIAYTSAGAIDHLRLGNGRWESFQYNDRLQVTQIGLGASIGDKSLLKIDYSYGTTDNNGSLKQQTITVPGMAYPLIQTYTYDKLNRVKSAQETSNSTQTWKQTFNYDRFGNRTFDVNNTTTPDSQQNQNIFNPSISETNNRFNTVQGYAYDATGNVTQDPQDQTFIYDADNMQTEVKMTSTSATKARYEYDGGGKRVKKIDYINNQETIFVYNAIGQLVAEYQTNYQAGNTRTSYLTSDYLGSPRVTTDSAGAVVSRHDYMAFGEEIYAGVGGRSSSQKYVDDNIRQKYTGYERDDESGLDYAQARYFSSQHGRFTSVDPLMASATIRNPQTFNRYTYALNSPYKFTDPLGLVATSPSGQGANDPYIPEMNDPDGNLARQKDKVKVPEVLIAAASLKTITVDKGTGSVSLTDKEVQQIKDYISDSYQAGFTEGKLLEQGAIDEITIKNSEARSTGEKKSQTDGMSINKDGPTLKNESTDEKSKGNIGGGDITGKSNMEARKTVDRNNDNLATERQDLINNLNDVTRTITYDDKKVSAKVDFRQYVDLLAKTAKIIGRVDGQQSIKKVQ